MSLIEREKAAKQAQRERSMRLFGHPGARVGGDLIDWREEALALEAQLAGAVAENEQLRADLTRVRGQRDALIEHEHVMTAEIDRVRAGG